MRPLTSLLLSCPQKRSPCTTFKLTKGGKKKYKTSNWFHLAPAANSSFTIGALYSRTLEKKKMSTNRVFPPPVWGETIPLGREPTHRPSRSRPGREWSSWRRECWGRRPPRSAASPAPRCRHPWGPACRPCRGRLPGGFFSLRDSKAKLLHLGQVVSCILLHCTGEVGHLWGYLRLSAPQRLHILGDNQPVQEGGVGPCQPLDLPLVEDFPKRLVLSCHLSACSSCRELVQAGPKWSLRDELLQELVSLVD